MTDFKDIKAFAFDIDGVATNGDVFCSSEGDLLRTYDAKDGFAIRMAVMKGFPVAIITGGSSESIRKRMVTSGVNPEDVFLHCRDKRDQFAQFCQRYSLKPQQVMYFGDDVPDIDVLLQAGIGACPSDATEEVLAIADWISPCPGGRGCLRSGIKAVLQAQGQWQFDPATYKKLF